MFVCVCACGRRSCVRERARPVPHAAWTLRRGKGAGGRHGVGRGLSLKGVAGVDIPRLEGGWLQGAPSSCCWGALEGAGSGALASVELWRAPLSICPSCL